MNKTNLIWLAAAIGVLVVTTAFQVLMDKQTKQSTKPFTAVMHNGMNMSEIECDSFKMISKTQAITYNNGVVMPIVADEIRIHSNEQ
jgi:large-conductance mechanosensitive channel